MTQRVRWTHSKPRRNARVIAGSLITHDADFPCECLFKTVMTNSRLLRPRRTFHRTTTEESTRTAFSCSGGETLSQPVSFFVRAFPFGGQSRDDVYDHLAGGRGDRQDGGNAERTGWGRQCNEIRTPEQIEEDYRSADGPVRVYTAWDEGADIGREPRSCETTRPQQFELYPLCRI